MLSLRSLPLLLPLLLSCDLPEATSQTWASAADTAGATTATGLGGGLFAEGCPVEGQALAREIGVSATLPGEVAVGTAGDFLLANRHAAYVITEPDKGSTYYYYGGILADAAAMDGCTPSEDRLDELAIVLGQIDLLDITGSILRGFRGETIEVLADGSDGGPATVRVTGTDDTHWLVEYELIAAAVESGGRPFSSAFGAEVTVDYTLSPNSPVLAIELSVRNPTDEDLSLFSAQLLSLAPSMDLVGYASDELDIGVLDLSIGIPWLVAVDDAGAGALAFGTPGGNLGYEGISGVDVAVDLLHATTETFDLSPGATDSRTVLVSVGGDGGPSATEPMAEANPEPLTGRSFSLEGLSGAVVDSAGTAVAGARVRVETRAPDADWGVLDVTFSEEDGTFTAPIPVFDGDPWEWRLVAEADGRDDSAEVTVTPGESGVSLEVSERGEIAYALTDDDGAPSPARLYLLRDDGQTLDLWLTASGVAPVPPGTWDFTATRGYEYAPVTGALEIPAGGSAELAAELVHVVDTSGYLSIDTHVHTSDSTDSRVTPADQLRHGAAHGLDVLLHTEHENIVDRSGLPAQEGLSDWITNVIGEEVTATLPEHMTMFPVEPDGSPRGGIVEWYGIDIDELFAEMRARSDGGINLINHPSYLDLIGWDRVTAEPTLDDPTLLGLPADAAVWSWNFDGIEVMNGHSSPFSDGNRRFDNWQSMINAGVPLVAVGCSDDHGGDEVGFPRTYFPSSSDRPADLSEDELVEAFRDGAVMASAGAFARVGVGGAGPGSLVTPVDDAVALDVHIEAIPEIDVTHAVVFVNCDQVMSIAADEPGGVVKLSERLEVPVSGDSVSGDAAITVAAFGEQSAPAGLPGTNAHTPRVLVSPIYVDADGDGLFSAPGGRECDYDLAAP